MIALNILLGIVAAVLLLGVLGENFYSHAPREA